MELLISTLDICCVVKGQNIKRIVLCQKLDETKPFPVIREVGIEEERLKEIETEILAKWERRHDEEDDPNEDEPNEDDHDEDE